ncbi:MAG: hypothetical protein XD40_0252 [Archaeoglobus fulgidus]|jgi:hypothetical protein|uniref:Uncharacterized protein n=2 Tax=Archaeoglobus fulgidus TaxID=2234 RepID=A0A075WAU4_ARCFL|nr:hypothetical protein AFULGI_00002750 [Archaeoglobus fulgidus DSM 8774]KUJ94479.1 MAG: hypothetical protein XD40_0252 [Archaeoglobus fulgidus]KUK05988.1 MAG: hypothetical protein XD48_1773 [Archaeoglobus fulgidus]
MTVLLKSKSIANIIFIYVTYYHYYGVQKIEG